MTDVASLVLAIDSTQVKTAVSELDKLTAAGGRAQGAATNLGQSLGRLGQAQSRITAEGLRVVQSINQFAQASNRLRPALNTVGASAGQMRAGMQQLSFQIGDVSQQFALGVRPMTIFVQQGGQVIQAIGLMRGSAGGFIGFLAGPWGAVLTGAAIILGAFVSRLGDAAEASDTAVTASDALGGAQSALGQMFDLSTGKIQNNTEALRTNILMQAAAMRSEARAAGLRASRAIADISAPRSFAGERFTSTLNVLANDPRLAPYLGGIVSRRRGAAQGRANIQNVVMQWRRGDLSSEQAINILSRFGGGAIPVAQAISDMANAPEAERLAEEIRRSVMSGELSSEFRRGGGGRTRKRAGRSTEGLEEFGRDAAVRLAELRDRFSDIPPQVQAVNRATNDLDDLLEDIERRKPPNWQLLLEQGRALRPLIQDALNRPFQEFVRSNEEALQILRLRVAGEEDEADALQIIFRLQKQMGALLPEQVEDIRNRVGLIRQEEEALKRIATLQQNSLEIERLRLEAQLAGTSSRERAVALARLEAEQYIRTNKTPLEQQRSVVQSFVDRANAGVLSPFQQWAASIPQTAEAVTEAIQSIQVNGLDSLADAITDVITGTRSLGDAFSDMARSIVADIIQMTVRMLIFRAISGIFGAPATGGAVPVASALGNVFARGGLVPFARGGIVTGPTLFPLNRGRAGVMGEAGPEAVMPLARDSRGRLGVRTANDNGPIEIRIGFGPAPDFVPFVEQVSAAHAAQAVRISVAHTNGVVRSAGRPKLMGR